MNNRLFLYALLISIFVPSAIFAQTDLSNPKTKRQRIFADAEQQQTNPTPTPTPRRIVIVTNNLPAPTPTPTPFIPPTVETTQPNYDNTPDATVQRRSFRYGEVRNRIAEAKRQMQIKPLRISLLDETQTTDFVRVAFFDYKKDQVDYVVLPKEEFLSNGDQFLKVSENGQSIRVQTIKGNGVNTPIIIYDIYNQAQQPLLVQYPIEKYGRFAEMAYYVSTHPGIVTPETVNAGKIYVRSILDAARADLKQKGIFIQPKVVDIAEKLALVEHVDHYRFRTEYHPKIYNDVYTLYALNQDQTYRYSVSSAGAGGMVQMIPATYRMIRSRYFSVGLMPDFVSGMRNHLNASKAMLLYMQMTWNELIASETVYDAMQNGFATQEQLMSAGYNSNPSRLPLYIRRGGAAWTSLIPRETKIYLQILESIERYVPMKPRNE
ncbi:MAG: hypothetical protein ACR2J3_01950 [Aridibacter sp.]